MNRGELVFDLITLWVTIDPVGTLPLYLAVTKHLDAKKRRRAAIRANIIAAFILAGFLFLGQYLLDEMKIELISFQIAGGIVLFLFAIGMIFEKESPDDAPADDTRDVAVFPLALPSIATPGALLAVVVLTENNTHNLVEQSMTCGVMLFVLGINLIIMLLGDRIIKILGRAGLNVLSRVMGMILAAAAVQMVYTAVVDHKIGPG